MRLKTAAGPLGMLLLISLISFSGQSSAYELSQKPGEPASTFDLRTADGVYDRQWIERTRSAYANRQTGSLNPVFVYLLVIVLVLLAVSIRVGARLNGLDRHLRLFPNNQSAVALRLWMLRRWGCRP